MHAFIHAVETKVPNNTSELLEKDVRERDMQWLAKPDLNLSHGHACSFSLLYIIA